MGVDLETRKVVKRIESETKSHWLVMNPNGKKNFTRNKMAPLS